jgi:hypothetical protein
MGNKTNNGKRLMNRLNTTSTSTTTVVILIFKYRVAWDRNNLSTVSNLSTGGSIQILYLVIEKKSIFLVQDHIFTE